MNNKFQPRRHTLVWATYHRKQFNQTWILKTWWLIEAESDLPECVCEYAMRPVCHHSLIPLRCLPNQRCLLLQKPRARWSAWCLCSPLEYPSDLASLDSWPQLLHTEYGSCYLWKPDMWLNSYSPSWQVLSLFYPQRYNSLTSSVQSLNKFRQGLNTCLIMNI